MQDPVRMTIVQALDKLVAEFLAIISLIPFCSSSPTSTYPDDIWVQTFADVFAERVHVMLQVHVEELEHEVQLASEWTMSSSLRRH